jgi:hypothetical protein
VILIDGLLEKKFYWMGKFVAQTRGAFPEDAAFLPDGANEQK